ncbi:hypothetical protein QF031_000017 [Pseudarthrobacter defluvii]|nr:hypothetical protein [Pseudarthrobacter defluvii]
MGGEPPEHPGAQEANYVYLQLNDGTVCQPVQKSGMEHVGDYGFQGFCTDGTFYYSRFDTARPPSDDSNPFGEGTDSEGRWLLKTDRPNAAPGELVSRSVEVAYR